MGANTKIAWADDTFNPWIGCQNVSPGCDHCYAEALNKRWGKDNWGPGKDRRLTTKANWKKPVKWHREAEAAGVRRRVFCASMADVFDNAVPEAWRFALWELIKETPWLDWILLTKRIGNVKAMLPEDWGDGYPNVWLCITVVNQEEAERDVQKLIDIPATVRGLSVEPQIGPIDLTKLIRYQDGWAFCDNALTGFRATKVGGWHEPKIDWVITGAESGPGRRDYDEDWARALRGQCSGTQTAFFYKQHIENGRKVETPELDGRTWTEFPKTSVQKNEGSNDQ